jgi:glucose-1-phosphate adenylyltransferase
MNYDELAKFHWKNGADITIAVQPVFKKDGSRFGLVKISEEGRIISFAEKPKDQKTLKKFVIRDDPEKPYLGSMGIYMFNTDILVDILNSTTDTDFGGEVIPRAIKNKTVFGFYYDGFWEDIGTIRSFYDANLRLTKQDSPFNFFDPEDPIYTRPRFLPGTIVQNAELNNVLLADGGRINGANIHDSIIGIRSQISEGTYISSSIIMGADFYNPVSEIENSNNLPIGIGSGCEITGAIIDKNVRVGNRVIIKPFLKGTEIENENWVVRDGIVVIPKNSILIDETFIGPE